MFLFNFLLFMKKGFLLLLLFLFSNAVISQDNFVSTWELTSSDLTFQLPLKNYTNITIDWGDSSTSTHTGGAFPTHTYSSSGTKTITVTVNDAAKDIGQMYMNNHASRTLIRTITNWGEGKWESFDYAFKGATYLTIPATDEPDLSLVTIMSHTFNECTNLVGLTLNDWNTSVVTSLDATFHDATAFNGDISSWNTSNVTTMRNMFKNAEDFNRDINTSGSSWNTGAVTLMPGMFMDAEIFNQEIGSWDTSEVTNMYYMFAYSSDFNGDISSWNTAKVTNMGAMFFDADAFNQNLSGWCVTNISSEPSAFSLESALTNANKPVWGTCPHFVSTWELTSSDLTFELPLKDYANITIDWGDSSTSTHTNQAFPTHTYSSSGTYTITIRVNDAGKDIGQMYMNGDHSSRLLIRTITNWGEGKWESFSGAFDGAPNLTIPATDEPDLSLTTTMTKAFNLCTSLVGTTLNDWNTAAVTSMVTMFQGASVFNGNIGSWNTAAVTSMA
jgi:surface protein